MDVKQNFTTEEWTLVCNAPTNAGAAISMIDAGVVAMIKEIAAITKTVTSAVERYPENTLIKSVVADLETSDTDEKTGDESVDELLQLVSKAAAVVDAKAPADAAGYKQFIFEIADRAANASGSGFFGFGQKVSPDEAAFLDRLRGTLQL